MLFPMPSLSLRTPCGWRTLGRQRGLGPHGAGGYCWNLEGAVSDSLVEAGLVGRLDLTALGAVVNAVASALPREGSPVWDALLVMES